MTVTLLLAVFAGGGFGALVRWLFGQAERAVRASHERPQDGWGTTCANLLACVVLAILLDIGIEPGWSSAVLVAGLCGGLSTFSSFALEISSMILDGRYRRASAHVAINGVLGLLPFLLLLT